MRAIIVVLVFVLGLSPAMADEIDEMATNVPYVWDAGLNPWRAMPKTATVGQLLSRFSDTGWLVGHVRITTNYTVLESRQIPVPPFPLTVHDRIYEDAMGSNAWQSANDCTAVLLQTSHGKKIVLFKYDKSLGEWGGWESTMISYPEDLRGPIQTGDRFLNWLDFPARRDANLHLALVEILNITNEHHTYTVSENSKVSDDGGRTWCNLLDVWSGTTTIRILESPGIQMPATLAVRFERSGYVHSRNETFTDWSVKPGTRVLCFFSTTDGMCACDWLISPAVYRLLPDYAPRFQALFKSPLYDKKTLADIKLPIDECSELRLQPFPYVVRPCSKNSN